MRINGTYLDRLLQNIVPLIGPIGVFFVAGSEHTKFYHIVGFIGLFWALDTFIMSLKRPKTLRIGQNRILIGNSEFVPSAILKVTPMLDKRQSWDFRTLEFEVLNSGVTEKLRVMAKPVFFISDLMGRKSKTIRLLLEKFPELEEKFYEEIIE